MTKVFNLSTKLALVVLSTLAVLLSVGFYIVTERQSEELLQELKKTAVIVSRLVETAVRQADAERQEDREQLQALTQYLAQLPNVVYVEVFDARPVVVAHTRPERLGGQPSPQHVAMIRKVFRTGEMVDEPLRDSDRYNRFVPVFGIGAQSGQVVGVIEVVMTLRGDAATVGRTAAGITTVVRETVTREFAHRALHEEALTHQLYDINRLHDVIGIEVYEAAGRRRFSSDNDGPSVDELVLQGVLKGGVRDEERWGARRYIYLTPLRAEGGGRVIGASRLIMDMDPVLDQISEMRREMAFTALLMALAMLSLLIWSLRQIVIDPLHRLSRAMREVALGRFDHVLALKTRDEMGQLGQAFNSMTSDLRRYRSELVRAKEYNENVLRAMIDPLLVVSPDGLIEHVNQAALALLDYAPEELLGQPISLLHGTVGIDIASWLAGAEVSERELIAKDGRRIPVIFSASTMRDAAGEHLGIVCVARDITERKRVEQALIEARDELEQRVSRRTAELSEEKERLRVTLHSIGDGVITADGSGVVVYLNPAAEQITGWTAAEARGRPISEIFTVVDEYSRERQEDLVQACLRRGAPVTLWEHSILVHRGGKEIAVESSARPIRDSDGRVRGAVLVLRDVTEERRLRYQLLHQARHDALTDLFNRREFEARLEQVLHGAHERGQTHALLYLDLDQFKVINDTCGHVAGDLLLKQLAGLLRERVRNGDMLARLGGDEFGVILEHITLDRAVSVAEAILEMVRQFRFVWQDKTFEVGVSIGLVLINRDSESPISVLSEADVACYAAKDFGRNRIHLYEASDADLARRHGEMQWVGLISKALEQGQLVLYYQTIRPLKAAAEEQHYEVLVRMRTDSGTLITPGAFLPAAERYNLMPGVDRWVIRETLRFYAEQWRARLGNVPHCIAINLSGTSLNQPQLFTFIASQIAEFDVRPETLCFEITETAAVANLVSSINLIKDLKGLGCRFALDDFGSGVSSFGYLKNLPVDYLKIDGSFVRDMMADPIDYAMVEAINRIGQVMGIKTVAEFVENEAILQALTKIGVDYAQGFQLDLPKPLV